MISNSSQVAQKCLQMTPSGNVWDPPGPPGSILEPPGVVLGASGVDSGAFQVQFEVDFWLIYLGVFPAVLLLVSVVALVVFARWSLADLLLFSWCSLPSLLLLSCSSFAFFHASFCCSLDARMIFSDALSVSPLGQVYSLRLMPPTPARR